MSAKLSTLSFGLGVSALPLSLFTGVLAAVLVWQLNKVITSLIPERRVLLSPLGEEAVKTLLAVLFGANIFLAHFFFGAVEGVWEMFSVRRGGFYAGLSALASHSIFGYITVFVYETWGVLLLALEAGYLVHVTWNYVILKYFARVS